MTPEYVKWFGFSAAQQWREWRMHMIQAGWTVEDAERSATEHVMLNFDEAHKGDCL